MTSHEQCSSNSSGSSTSNSSSSTDLPELSKQRHELLLELHAQHSYQLDLLERNEKLKQDNRELRTTLERLKKIHRWKTAPDRKS